MTKMIDYMLFVKDICVTRGRPLYVYIPARRAGNSADDHATRNVRSDISRVKKTGKALLKDFG